MGNLSSEGLSQDEGAGSPHLEGMSMSTVCGRPDVGQVTVCPLLLLFTLYKYGKGAKASRTKGIFGPNRV